MPSFSLPNWCHKFARECGGGGTFCAFEEDNGKRRKCECADKMQWKKFRRNCGRRFEVKRLNCASQEPRKAASRFCYKRKKAGQFCVGTSQCVDDGAAQYFCIANICQIPPECPPGHISVGAECFPFAVTGGECVHAIQCLAGSICIKGRCRGPCEADQLFVEDGCVPYEGAGCIARSCVKHKCPRAFPSCNYVPQKGEYLCCDRQIRSIAQCANPLSMPQLSTVTNEVVNCLSAQCQAGFECQFSNAGRGSYICCSIPSQQQQKRNKKWKRINH